MFSSCTPFPSKKGKAKNPKQTKNRQEVFLICSWQFFFFFKAIKFQYFLRKIHLDFLGGMEIENVK